MSLNFPVDPSDGDLYEGYIFDDTAGVWNSNPAQIASRFVTSASAPENPSEGDGWFDSTTAKSYTYYDGVWVQIGAPGAIRFNQLEGIEVTDPVDGEIIVYDSASSQWVNQELPEPVLTFSGLNDTSIATPATGDSLVYDGSDWTNQPLSSRRNLLYNGAMQVHQRGTSVTGLAVGGYYTADRWQTSNNLMGVWTQTIENDAPAGTGFRKSLKMLCTTADASPAAADLLLMSQDLEGQDVQGLKKGTSSAEPVTLSFWVKSNVTGTFIARLSDIDNSRSISTAYTINSANTWEKKIFTAPGDTTGVLDNDNNSSIRLQLFLGVGSNFSSGILQTTWQNSVAANIAVGQTNLAAATNNYWQITGVQLEVGPVATPFEFKPYGQELAECQRYYYRITADADNRLFGGSYNVDTTQAAGVAAFPVTMRDRPTALEQSGTANQYAVVHSGFTFTGCSGVPIFSAGTTKEMGAWIFTVASGITAGQGSQGRANSSGGTGAYLAWSAEL